MKLAYFQSCGNPLDPLPELGCKVAPAKTLTPEQKRAQHVKDFEVRPHEYVLIGCDFAKTPELQVTFEEVAAAVARAKKRLNDYGLARIHPVALSLMGGARKLRDADPACYPKVIAALEALQ